MKKLVRIGMAIGLIVSMITPTYAYNNNEIEIISGDGSFDNPYVLADYDNEIGEFIINNYEEKKGSGGDNENARSVQIFTSSTVANSSKSVADPGSYWYRTSGGGSVNYNGSMVFVLIDYTNHSQMGDMCAQALKGGVQSALRSIISNNYNTTTAKNTLKNLGISNNLIISGLLPAIGYAADTYGGLTDFGSLSSAIQNEILADTQLNDHHLMTVHYKTAYNGAWYLHCTIEESMFKTFPQIPKEAYGVGTYANRTRIS